MAPLCLRWLRSPRCYRWPFVDRVSGVFRVTYFWVAVTSICLRADSLSSAPTYDCSVAHGNIFAYTHDCSIAHGNIFAYTDVDADANGYAAAHGDTTADSNSNSATYSSARRTGCRSLRQL